MSVENVNKAASAEPESLEIELDLTPEAPVKSGEPHTKIEHQPPDLSTVEPEKPTAPAPAPEPEKPTEELTPPVAEDEDNLELPENLDEETKKKWGLRAKRRIGKLTRERHERDAQIAELQAALEEERAQRANLARQNEQSIYNAWHQAENRLKNELALAQRDLKAAATEGDIDAQTEAQSRVIKAQVDLENTSRNRAAAEARWKAGTTQVTPPAQPQQRIAPQQPTRPGPSEKAVAWKEKNSVWFGKDQAMTGAALGIHNELVEEGVAPDSDEYYKELDSRIRASFPAKFAPQRAPNAAAQQTVASPTRAPATNVSKTKVTLTASQQAMAKRLGLTNEQYAREVYRMQNGA